MRAPPGQKLIGRARRSRKLSGLFAAFFVIYDEIRKTESVKQVVSKQIGRPLKSCSDAENGFASEKYLLPLCKASKRIVSLFDLFLSAQDPLLKFSFYKKHLPAKPMVFQFRAVSPNTAASARADDAPAGMRPLLASRERAPFRILFFPSCLALFYFSVFFLKAALSSFLFIVNTFFDSCRYCGDFAIPKERRFLNLRSLFSVKFCARRQEAFFFPRRFETALTRCGASSCSSTARSASTETERV